MIKTAEDAYVAGYNSVMEKFAQVEGMGLAGKLPEYARNAGDFYGAATANIHPIQAGKKLLGKAYDAVTSPVAQSLIPGAGAAAGLGSLTSNIKGKDVTSALTGGLAGKLMQR
jgi:hypothetical protein